MNENKAAHFTFLRTHFFMGSVKFFKLNIKSWFHFHRQQFTTNIIKWNAKKPNIRNNFIYKNNSAKLVDKQKAMVVSADLLAMQSNTSYKTEKHEKKTSSLQYRGEILYGIHPVYLALLQKRRHIFKLFLRRDNEHVQAESGNTAKKAEIESLAKRLQIPISHVDSRAMKNLAPTAVHQGVCLDASHLPLLEWQEADISFEYHQDSTHIPLWLILDEIIDPMNVGAIIRSAHYFGINRLFVVRGHSCKLSPTVSKASSGALEVMNIYQIETLEPFIEARKSEGWNVVSTVSYCENQFETIGPVVDITELKVSKPTILILGNEGAGISTRIQKLCDSFVSIYPKGNLHQGIDSLNVSVATGVILHALSLKTKQH